MTAEGAKRWTWNGYKYWSLRTADAEIVASIGESFAPYHPPMHAKYELYTLNKMGFPRFEGYLEGEQRARAHLCFQQAFAERNVG
jgi:hypothetical protein